MECEDIGLEIRAFVEGKESGGKTRGIESCVFLCQLARRGGLKSGVKAQAQM